MDTKVNHLLDISSFLDLRFKLEHIIEENQTACKEVVIDEGLNIFDLAVEVDETEPAQPSLTSASTMSDERPPPKKKSS